MSSSTTPNFGNFGPSPEVKYLVARDSAVPRLQGLVGAENLHRLTASGGKVLVANHPICSRTTPTLILRHSGLKVRFGWRFLQLRLGYQAL